MGKNSFRIRFFTAASVATIAMAVYQHCSVDSSGGMSNLGSRGSSPNGSPTVSLDNGAMVVATSASSLTLTGNCNTGGFANYLFEVNYRVGSNSGLTHRYDDFCISGRFSINVPFGHVGISPGTPGNITLSLIGLTSSGEVLGPQSFARVDWSTGGTSGGTTSSTTGGTTGGTTSGTTGSTTSGTTGTSTGGTSTTSGGTTGCSPTCDPNRACGSTQDSCGGNSCPARHCNTCRNWQSSAQVASMSDHRVHSDMNTLQQCQEDCDSYYTADCCQYDSANRICYVVLSGNCSIGGGPSNMQATDCN